MNMRHAFAPHARDMAASHDARADEWNELADQASEPNIFYHPAMLLPALELLDRQKAVRIIEARANGQLIGMLPVETSPHYGRFPIRCVTNMTHAQCFFGAPLLRAGHEEAAWAALLDQMDADRAGGHFLHLTAQDADGPSLAALRAVCAAQHRPMAQVHHYERAMLHSTLSPDAYWETHVRAKKRKELRRQLNRLHETGAIEHRRLTRNEPLDQWCADFLALESSGWKGDEGTALAIDARSHAYFHAVCARAHAGGLLDMLRIDVDGRAIAMLVNFRHGAGSFSFKTAIDEAFGRYSPGVLIQIDNLHSALASGGPAWMDSCALPDHPMIDSLWAERRTIAQYRVALRGVGARAHVRSALFHLTGGAEAALRHLKG